jgi:hypothetical protein
VKAQARVKKDKVQHPKFGKFLTLPRVCSVFAMPVHASFMLMGPV